MSDENIMHYNEIIKFWFEEIESDAWYRADPEFDNGIAVRFRRIHTAATVGELCPWRAASLGRLAEVIVLDQFSRNIYRNTPRAFTYDPLALILAQEAINVGAQREMNSSQRDFLYMPFMHSESSLIHDVAEKLFSEPELASNLKFELRHKAIIQRFGRYPHRNAILGRISTAEELEFLNQPGSSF